MGQSEWLVLKVVGRGSTKEKPQLFVIPKKVVRLSTRRNRLKRLLRESIRRHKVLAEEFLHQKLLFILRKPPEEFNLAVVSVKVKELLEKESRRQKE